MNDLVAGLTFSFTGWDAILAVAVLVASWITARYARRAVDRVFARVKVPDDVRGLGGRFASYVVIFLGVGIALGLLGVSIQPVLAVVILLSVLAALALRGVADNVAAGVVIQTRQSVHLGDSIESQDFVGTVRELTSRSVIIETSDGRLVHLPNQKVLDNPLVNHTTVGRRSSDLQIRVTGGEVTELTSQVLEVLSRTPGVLAEPAPRVLVRAIEAGRATLVATYWHSSTAGVAVTSEAVLAISASLAGSAATVAVVAPPPGPPVTPPAEI